MGKVKERWKSRQSDADVKQNTKGFNRDTTGPACEPGTCKIAYDHVTGMRRCRRCGMSVQTLTTGERYPLPGDWRVVCRGPKDSDSEACPIGPSRVIPAALKQTALEEYNEHQRKAVEVDGCTHDCEVIQFPIE